MSQYTMMYRNYTKTKKKKKKKYIYLSIYLIILTRTETDSRKEPPTPTPEPLQESILTLWKPHSNKVITSLHMPKPCFCNMVNS